MKKIFANITIDVETPQTPMIEGRVKDNRIWSNGWGIEKIVEILNKYSLKGDFFTNVYEYKIWGIGEINRICEFLAKDHFVELHTHPFWIDTKRRENMNELSFSEQSGVINKGVEIIEKATGSKPKCHRAGAYGFNHFTLEACKENGIFIDSSNFYGHKFCGAIFTKNKIVKVGEVWEMPVTYIEVNGKFVKTDINWMDENLFNKYFQLVKNSSDLNYLNLFLHSYSLTETTDNYKSFKPSQINLSKLDNILQILASDPQVEFCPMWELPEKLGNGYI